MGDTNDDPKLRQYLDIAQLSFMLSYKNNTNLQADQAKMMEIIEKNGMAPFYKTLSAELGWTVDEKLLSTLEKANAEELEKLEQDIKDAEENQGESELREALLAKALFLKRIGEKEKAIEALEETYKKTVGVQLKLDLVMHILTIGLFHLDFPLLKTNFDKAKILLEEGGDWEHRNRLKVYEATYLMAIRDFKKAAHLLLDSVATFTAYELFSYDQFVKYTVQTSMLSLPRSDLKKKVVDAPEILQVILNVPPLEDFLNSLYDCNYSLYMEALCGVVDQMQADRYTTRHYRWYCREMRLVAYNQFLESYKSVTMSSMSQSFGVSTAFIDKELANMIASGRISCKMDKVSGIVEINRPDRKNAQYQATIKQGDLLLNRIQKLCSIINA